MPQKPRKPPLVGRNFNILAVEKKLKNRKKRPKIAFCNPLIFNTNFLSKFTQILTIFLPYFRMVDFGWAVANVKMVFRLAKGALAPVG
jgi:hypothetical protein